MEEKQPEKSEEERQMEFAQAQAETLDEVVRQGRSVFVVVSKIWDGFSFQHNPKSWRLTAGWLVIGYIRGDLDAILMATHAVLRDVAAEREGAGDEGTE